MKAEPWSIVTTPRDTTWPFRVYVNCRPDTLVTITIPNGRGYVEMPRKTWDEIVEAYKLLPDSMPV